MAVTIVADRKDNRGIHMHIAGNADFRLPALDYKNLIEAALFLTKSKAAAEKVYRLMIFNVLTHNRDDHAENFSFVYDDDIWQVSPACDLVYSDGFKGEHATNRVRKRKPFKRRHIKPCERNGN
jgi:serine/threonine-protein kinase HipA